MSKVLIEIEPIEESRNVRTSISISTDQEDPTADENFLAVALAQWLNEHIEEHNFEIILRDFADIAKRMH
jgi:hypothetical protein